MYTYPATGSVAPQIVAITADAMVDNLRNIVEVGMNGYILKPFKIKQLEDVIMALFTNKR